MTTAPLFGSEEQLDLRAFEFVSDAEIDDTFDRAYRVYCEGQRYDAAKHLQLAYRRLNAIETVKRLPGWNVSLVEVEAYVRAEIRHYVGRLRACSRNAGRAVHV